MSASQTRFFSLSHLGFLGVLCLLPRVVNSDIISPKPFIRNVGQDAVFMWNSTNGNRILEARWGLLSAGLLKPQFIYIDISKNLVYSNDLDGNASSYKGRVRWVGDLSAGHAWFKITNLIISDTNQYAANILEQGKTKATIYSTTLTVSVVPKILALPSSPYYIKENDDLAISCSAIGPPVPSVKWVNKDGTELPTGSGTATLDIKNIQRSKSGMYKCLASNNPNEVPVQATITVVLMYPPYFTSLPENKTVIQNQSVSLTCTADGFLKPNITWSKLNGNKIDPGQVSNNKLTITSASKSDDGEYVCTASIVLKSKLVSYNITTRAYITVKYEPSILNKSSNRVVNETDSLRLTCTADGYPTPSFTWSKSPGTITPSVTTGNEYNILSVSRSDAGTYTCTANNGIGASARANVQVTVQYKPIIDVSLSTSNISSWVGNKVTLKCFAHGLPAPYFTWYMSGNQQITSGVTNVTNGSHVTTTTTEESIAYGSYKCEARNVAGFDEHLIYITQLFAPGPPNIAMTKDDIEAVSITVRWITPDYDGGTTVIDYKVQVNSTNPPQEKNTSNNQVDFTGLEKNTKYEVKVFARNKVGYGNPTIKIITTKKQGQPSSPDIELHSNQTAITLSWVKPDEKGGEIAKYTIYANGNRIGDVISRNSELKYVVYIKKLTPGTTYTFIVTAMNQYGESVKDQNKAKSIRIPEVPTPTKIWTTVIEDKKPSGSSTKQQHKCSITGLAICLAILVVSLILNLLQFLFIWRNTKKKGSNVDKNTKRITTHQAADYPVYADALEMEENLAACVTMPETPQTTTSPTAEYEPIRVSHTVITRNDPTNKTARDMVDSTSKGHPSHYQELIPQIAGSVSQQDQAPTYEPLHRQQSPGLSSLQPANVANATYQPLNIKNSPSDYQSLHSYDNTKQR